MKILLDANTPAPLARFLRGHQVVRADELGWQGLENGALLDAAEQGGFDLLLTCDQNGDIGDWLVYHFARKTPKP